MERKKEVNWLKIRRKTIVGLSICLSPVILAQIGYYCQRFYEAHNVSINNTNYGSFFAMLGFVVIVIIMNLIGIIDNRKILNDVHNITQILLQVVLEDSEENKANTKEIISFVKKYGGK